MIKVLHVVGKMSYGGIETFIMNVYRNINKEEVQFDFAVSSKGEYDKEIKQLGGNIYFLPKRNEGILKYKKAWNDFIKENNNKYNAIHMHVSSLTNILPIKVAKKYNIQNRFIHAHNTHQKGIIHNILNYINKFRVLKYATKLFACSTEAGKYCYGNLQFEVINNGIQAQTFAYNPTIRKEKRSELNIKDDKQICFINVSRFSEQKNHTFLIDIFKEILKINPNSKLFLVGEGKLKKEIEDKAKRIKLQDNVKFLGKRSDIKDILQAMDAFLLPSLHEGLPVAGIEAQAAGLKLYTSNTVSPELKITDLVKFYSLKDTPEQWAYNITKDLKGYKRKNMYEKLVASGYDIEATSRILQNYYSKGANIK